MYISAKNKDSVVIYSPSCRSKQSCFCMDTQFSSVCCLFCSTEEKVIQVWKGVNDVRLLINYVRTFKSQSISHENAKYLPWYKSFSNTRNDVAI